MAQPDFSIVIPTFNRARQLAECLQAIASLEYPRESFEVIIVDDGGTVPAAPEIARMKPGFEITVLRQDRQGPAAARNSGARISRGRYLAFTDDDCLPEPGWLAALAASLQSHAFSLVGGRVVNALAHNPYSTASQIILDMACAYYRSGQQNARFFSSNNMAMLGEAFKKIGGFDENFRFSEDRDLCDRWLAAGYGMIYASDAVIRHAHPLDFCSFYKQHMQYGRGAWHYFCAYRRRHPGRTSIEPGFYLRLMRQLPALVFRQHRNRTMLALLLALWQAANLTGFISEAAFSDGIRKTSGADRP